MNLILLSLIIILVVFFVYFTFLYLKKDNELIMLLAKYDGLQKDETAEVENGKKRDDFMAMVVHELRSPLAVIKGSADLLLKSGDALAQDQKYTLLSQMRNSAGELISMVNDLLDVSKIESGRFEVKSDLGDINALLRDEASYYMALAREHEINVSLELNDTLPKVKFDKERVRQVVNNLLSNALKFTNPGGVVKLSSRRIDDAFVEISVSDSGIGIPDNMKGKLFHKFVQLDLPHNEIDKSEKGSGLGLTIAKGIIEAHGGNIWIEDNDPTGAKFLFTLPF